jgi:hypothetical protein
MLRCYLPWIGVPALLALLFLLAPLWSAEEAWRGDGRRVRGNLTLDGEQLRFHPTEGAAIASADLKRIRFEGKSPAPFRIGAGRRVRLWDGEQITGQIIDLDKAKLCLRTAWSERVEIPRAAVAAIESLPGWRTLMHDDWKVFALRGEPKRTETDALLLGSAGQEWAYTLPQPLAAGRFGVNFRQQEPKRGGRWTVELRFQRGEQARRVSLALAGNGEPYVVDAGERGRVSAPSSAAARNVIQTPGWHRLIVQFGKRSLRLTCDDEVLWYNLDEGPSGTLRRVTIHCQRGGGATAWSEFCLERAVDEHPKPPTEPEQDEIRSLDDDQLFGRILQANRRTLEIEGRFGKRSIPWTALSACAFRRPAVPPQANEGSKVRLHIDSGLCAEADVLEGVVTALDARRLVLRHALLGALSFERGRVRELHPCAAGERNPRP